MSDSQPTCPVCSSPLEADLCPDCTLRAFAAVGGLTPQTSAAGPEIAGFTVHEKIGEGGFGIVYRATQTGVAQRRVALKILKPGVDTRAVLHRFAAEKKLLATLDHPHIARFYAAGETPDGYPWFTMEYVEGEPVHTALLTAELDTVVRVFIKVCEAIAHAHDKGVVHRDLKPANILISPTGSPKIIDFGIAKSTHQTPEPGVTLYTAGEINVGTPAYRPPEDVSETDARSDVFALGVTLYETVTGLAPQETDSPLPRASRAALRKLPRDLDHIIAKATAKKPADRYQSATDLAQDLHDLLAGRQLSFAKPPRTPYLIATTAALVLLCALAFTWWPRTPDALAEPGSSPPFQLVTHHASGHPGGLAISPQNNRALAVFRSDGPALLFDPRDGHLIATYPAPPRGIGSGKFDESGDRFLIGYSDGSFRWYASDDGHALSPYHDCTPNSQVWVPDLASLTPAGADHPIVFTVTPDSFGRAWSETGTLQWETPLVSPPYALAISPDRHFAITGSASGRLNLIDLTAGTKRILEGHSAATYRIAYSPDGSHFACASHDHHASLWHSDGTLIHMLPHGDKCDEVAFSPDGSLLASTSADGNARIWEVSTGRELHRLPHTAAVLALAFSPDGQTLATGGKDDVIKFWNPATGQENRDPFYCHGAVAELEYFQSVPHQDRLLALTWKPELLVIPVE